MSLYLFIYLYIFFLLSFALSNGRVSDKRTLDHVSVVCKIHRHALGLKAKRARDKRWGLITLHSTITWPTLTRSYGQIKPLTFYSDPNPNQNPNPNPNLVCKIPLLARRTRPKGRPSAARDDRVSCIQTLTLTLYVRYTPPLNGTRIGPRTRLWTRSEVRLLEYFLKQQI